MPQSRWLCWSIKLDIFIWRAFQKPLLLNSLTRTKHNFQFCFGIAKVLTCVVACTVRDWCCQFRISTCTVFISESVVSPLLTPFPGARRRQQSPYFYIVFGPRNWFQGMNSASLCSLAGRYKNPIPPQCLAPIDFLKIPAQSLPAECG